MKEKIYVELVSENPNGGGYFYADLELPATAQQIQDARQRARFSDDGRLYRGISVPSSPSLPELEDIRLDSTTVEELNYFAQRLDALPDEELLVYRALFQKQYGEAGSDNLLSVKDLINMTYGLDSVMVAANITNDEQLGQFVIDNDLHPDIAAIPEESLYLLDKRRVGELQRQVDDGVYMDGIYVATGVYELPNIYDGEHLPEPEDEYEDILDFGLQNEAAERYLAMSDAEQVKFKAILEAENIQSMDEMLKAADRLDEYELAYLDSDAGTFYKGYLAHYLSVDFDCRWLDTLLTQNEGQHLLDRLGAHLTQYGVLSARGGHLYDPVPYDAPERELTTQGLTDEKLEVVEVLGQTALFTNGRVTQKGLPEGLYKYDLREGESVSFATVEPGVAVNHAGTIITKQPIIFGAEGYIAFDEDSSPNFLGEELTIEEFQRREFTQEEDETVQQMGGPQL